MAKTATKITTKQAPAKKAAAPKPAAAKAAKKPAKASAEKASSILTLRHIAERLSETHEVPSVKPMRC